MFLRHFRCLMALSGFPGVLWFCLGWLADGMLAVGIVVLGVGFGGVGDNVYLCGIK